MHKLVAENMVSFGERSCQWQHHSALEPLGDASGAFSDHAADDVRLFEVGVRGIQYERLTRAHLVLEDARQSCVPPLGHAADAGGSLALFLVEIDVEVVGLEHLEFEIFVLHLVPTEVLRLRRRGGREEQENDRQTGERDSAKNLPHGELLKKGRRKHPATVLPKSRQLHTVQFSEEIGTKRGETVARLSSDKYGARLKSSPAEDYRIFMPSADSASSMPSSAVVLRMSSVGLTSTRSRPINRPDSAIISMSKCASR